MDANNENPDEVKPKITLKKVKLWTAIVLGVMLLVIAFQNRQPLEVSLLFWNPRIPGVVLLPFVFLLGVVAGYIVRRKSWGKPENARVD